MSEEPPLSPEVDRRFHALADAVGQEDWNKLIGAVTDRMLKRLALTGLIQDASPESLQQGRLVIGELLVEYTNVALTLVAQGEAARRND